MDFENTMFALVADGDHRQAIEIGETLRMWWMHDDRWTVEGYREASSRVAWLQGFAHALRAVTLFDIDRRNKQPKRRRKTSGASGKKNQS